MLTFQGTADPLVTAEQAKALHEALKKAGVTEKLVLLEGAGHGWGGKEKERTDRLMLEFLDRHLKANRCGPVAGARQCQPVPARGGGGCPSR